MNFISKTSFRKNVTLAWPLALNSILVQSMVLVDLTLIAPLGEISVAALGIASAILALLIGTQYALANGTQLLLARAAGAAEPNRIASTLIEGWLLNFAFTLFTSAALYVGGKTLVAVVVDNPEIAVEANQYLRVSAITLLISSISQVMIAYYNGNGQTRVPLYGYFYEIPVNAALSLILIYGHFGLPALGLQGAAYGSLAAMLIRMSYLALQLTKQPTLPIRHALKTLRSHKLQHHLQEIFPIATNFVTLAIGVMIHQMLFAQLDVYSYAAITLVMPWMQLGAQFVSSWSLATSINVSQLLGKQETKTIPEFVTHAVRIVVVVGVILSLVFLAFSQLLPMLYPSLDLQTQQALAAIAPIYIAIPLVRTFNGLCGHTLRALGHSMVVLQIHFVTQWIIGIPFLLIAVYLNAPLWIVFGTLFFEECLKVFYFRKNLVQNLARMVA